MQRGRTTAAQHAHKASQDSAGFKRCCQLLPQPHPTLCCVVSAYECRLGSPALATSSIRCKFTIAVPCSSTQSCPALVTQHRACATACSRALPQPRQQPSFMHFQKADNHANHCCCCAASHSSGNAQACRAQVYIQGPDTCQKTYQRAVGQFNYPRLMTYPPSS